MELNLQIQIDGEEIGCICEAPAYEGGGSAYMFIQSSSSGGVYLSKGDVKCIHRLIELLEEFDNSRGETTTPEGD